MAEKKIKKTEQKKNSSKSKDKKETQKKDSEKYWYSIGRRKASVAQVRIYKNSKSEYTVNGIKMEKYFPTTLLQNAFSAPLSMEDLKDKFKVSVLAKGGGKKGQAEAAQLGIARALVLFDDSLKKYLKAEGFLTRDARKVERKKPGLKKARKSPQWKKR